MMPDDNRSHSCSTEICEVVVYSPSTGTATYRHNNKRKKKWTTRTKVILFDNGIKENGCGQIVTFVKY